MADLPQSRRSSPRILFGAAIGLVILVLLLPSFLMWWPPASLERRGQRLRLAERVQLAGGWEAVRRDCTTLAEGHTNFFYMRGRDRDTTLPPAIAALSPHIVVYDTNYSRVTMKIFGRFSTHGHSTPLYGLEVITKNVDGFKPGEGYNGVRVKEVADGIYEIY